MCPHLPPGGPAEHWSGLARHLERAEGLPESPSGLTMSHLRRREGAPCSASPSRTRNPKRPSPSKVYDAAKRGQKRCASKHQRREAAASSLTERRDVFASVLFCGETLTARRAGGVRLLIKVAIERREFCGLVFCKSKHSN